MNEFGPLSSYLTYLLGGTILVGIFVFATVLKTKPIGKSRYFLAAIILFLSLHLNTFILFITGVFKEYPNLLGISYPGLFLIGPLYYFFIKSHHNIAFRFHLTDLFHLVPFICSFLMQLPYYFKNDIEKIEIINYLYDLPTQSFQLDDWILSNVFMVLILIYAAYCLKILLKENNKNDSIFRKISFCLMGIAIAHLVLQTGLIIDKKEAILAEIILACLFASLLLFLGSWLVTINSIFVSSNKYKTSPLSSEESKTIKSRLLEFLENEELYLKSGLKLKDLSEVIHVPSHHISQVINEQMETGFHDLINKYRIDKAKKLLREGAAKLLSIEAIGEACGFANKSSFYRAFKKFANKTPSEYLKSHIKIK